MGKLNMNEKWVFLLINLLIAIVGFFFVSLVQNTNQKITEMSKELYAVKIELVEIQAKLITEEKVQEIVRNEMRKKDAL